MYTIVGMKYINQIKYLKYQKVINHFIILKSGWDNPITMGRWNTAKDY